MDSLLKYWINSIPMEGCALLESARDLLDGSVYMELACFVEDGASIPASQSSNSSEGRIRGVICFLAEKHSWSSMPHVLRQADASERIAAGDQELAVLLAKYIKFVFDCYIEVEEKLQGTNSTDEDAGPQHSTSRSAPRRGSDHPETAEAPEPQVTVAVTSTAERTATLTSDQKSIAVTRKPQTAKTRSKSPAAKAGVERSSAFLRPRPSSTKANALQPVPAPIRASSPPRISRNSSGLNKKVNERARSPTRATAEARIAAYPRDPLYSERITVQRAQQARSPGREPALSAPMRAEIILWLEALGVYSASVSYRRLHYTPVAGVASSVRRPDLPPLEDPWCNGVLLCELAAVLCKTGDRSLVKEVPAVCACGVGKPDHFERRQQLTERSSLKPAESETGGAGIGWHRDRPRIVIAGTVVQVKSMAQVHKNVQFALNILKNPDMTGLPKSLLLPVSARHNRSHGTSISEEDVLDCLPEDVVTGRVSIWLILQRVHTAYRMSAERQQRVRSRSRSPGRAIRRSVTPNTTIVAVAPPPPPVAGDKSGGASKKTERILDTAHEPAASASPIEYNRRSAALDSTSATHDTSLTSAEMKAASVAVTSTADPRRREPPLHLTTSGVIKRDRTQLHQPAWDGTMTPKRGRSWREVQLWGKGPARRARSSSPRRGNHLLRKLSATVDPVASTEILLHSNINSRPSSIRRSGSRQDVPGLTELDSDIASRDAFLPVTHSQQEAVRRWIIDLGIEFRDGDGGFLSRSFATSGTPDQPPLQEDRLRNGLTLCDLALVLEPNAARHLKLHQLVKKAAVTSFSLPQAQHRVERALFLFRMRRCPPIPLQFLLHSEPILTGRKNALWGLIWEVMQAYPAVAVGGLMQGDEELRESNGKVSAREPVLLTAPSMKATPAGPMSPDSVADSCSDPQQMHSLTKHRPPTVDGSVSDVFSNRRKKERAICDWIQDLRLDGKLQDVVGLYALGLQEPRAGQTALCVNSLQQLENCIRNGTLLCSLADGVFGIPIKAWSKTPRSYNQCLSNVQKATEGLQRMRGFPLVIYGGADDDIVRGEWSIIVELLHCLSTHPGGMLLNAKKPVSTTRSRPSWETVCNTEIVPSRAASAVAERGSSSSDMKDAAPGDDIFDDTFLPPKPPHVSNRAADLYPAGAVKSISHTPLLRSQNRHEDVLLDVDIDDAYRTLPADSEVAAILSESISSKLIRELQAASIGAAREDSPPPPPPRDRNEQPPDILPTKEIIKKGPRGDMILVQRRTPAPQTAAPPSTPSVARSSLDTPDWIRDLQSIGGAEKRPQNKDHDEVHSVQESPGPAAEQPTTSRRDALLDAVTRRGQDASEGSLRSNLKRASQRSSSAPPAKRQPPVAYNAHPLPKEGQDVLTSKRIRDAKIIISWLTDLNVDTEPLKDLIRIVRERHSQESDREGGVAYGYVNPVPAAFPQKDITSCMCELVATLDWKYPHSPQSLSHAALGSIPGTVTHPRHQAHRLQNIKRAFEVLANNNKIPLSALTCEEAVLEGRIDIILSLLMTIRKAYSISIGQR